MSRCIVHVGMHKTGSSSIQRSLHGFSDGRFLYADLGREPNHSLAIYSLFATFPEKHHLHRAGSNDAEALHQYQERMLKDLEQAIAAARGKTLILSGEDIRSLSRAELARMYQFLRPRFDSLSVVAYVRPPAGFMASVFQQRMKGGVVSDLNVEREYPNYEAGFSKFDAVFGREHVQLWKFDPAGFPNRCVVRDFCNRLGIALPAECIVRLNESLPRHTVALLYTYRKFGQKLGAMTMKGPESLKLGALLAGIGQDKFRFSPDVVRPVLERRRADIEWMEARLGRSLQEDLGAHQPGDVRDEADLLRPARGIVAKLRALLGDKAPVEVTGETPEQVALLVHALRGECARAAGAPKLKNEAAAWKAEPAPREHDGDTQMKVAELIEHIQQANPQLLAGIPPNRAAALIRTLFKHMNDTLAGTEEGVVKFAGLGLFRVKRVEKEVDGAKVAIKRILFVAGKPVDEATIHARKAKQAGSQSAS